MKNSGLLGILAAASVVVMIGTIIIGRSTVSKSTPVRAERRIGDQNPGPLISPRTVAWTPVKKRAGRTVTVVMKPYDARVARFADFPVLLPVGLPPGSHLTTASLSLDPVTHVRLVQFAIQGKSVGLISEQRLKAASPDFPAGIALTTVKHSGGEVFRDLQSDVGGVGVSIAFDLTISDDELIKIFRSLRPVPRPWSGGPSGAFRKLRPA